MIDLLKKIARDQSGWYGGEASSIVYLLLVVIIVIVLLKVLLGVA